MSNSKRTSSLIMIASQKLWETLFPYQKEGVTKLITHFRGRALLGDEMGLGKTYQGLFFLGYYKNTRKKRALIICPSYLRHNWKVEVEKWFDYDIQVITKGKDELTGEVVIISYDLMPESKIFHSLTLSYVTNLIMSKIERLNDPRLSCPLSRTHHVHCCLLVLLHSTDLSNSLCNCTCSVQSICQSIPNMLFDIVMESIRGLALMIQESQIGEELYI